MRGVAKTQNIETLTERNFVRVRLLRDAWLRRVLERCLAVAAVGRRRRVHFALELLRGLHHALAAGPAGRSDVRDASAKAALIVLGLA